MPKHRLDPRSPVERLPTQPHTEHTRWWRRPRPAAAMGLGAVALLALTATMLLGPPRAGIAPEEPAAAPGAGPVRTSSSRPTRTADDPSTATANLPAGAAYTLAGSGHWQIVDGAPQSATADPSVVTYTVEIEDGLDPASFGGAAAFATDVEGILDDPRSWSSRKPVQFVRIDHGTPTIHISLTSPMTTRSSRLCGFEVPYEGSCYDPRTNRVVINLARWTRGAVAFDGNLRSYREYAINHEVGHALGEDHVGCPVEGAPAPVMMQQSYGTENDHLLAVNRSSPAELGRVPDNDVACRANPWP